tara:strand:+ start:256 stop:486 length:231 start_codon:yes stop_codon:yes gene_type:complete
MPQIGWFEILIIVTVAILVIGPKDFPIVLKKIGNFIGSTKRYFSNIQEKLSNFDDEIKAEEPKETKSSKKEENKNG